MRDSGSLGLPSLYGVNSALFRFLTIDYYSDIIIPEIDEDDEMSIEKVKREGHDFTFAIAIVAIGIVLTYIFIISCSFVSAHISENLSLAVIVFILLPATLYVYLRILQYSFKRFV